MLTNYTIGACALCEDYDADERRFREWQRLAEANKHDAEGRTAQASEKDEELGG